MTAPDPEVESLGAGDCDVSTLFEPRQLRGRQVSWQAVRLALAELGRSSSLGELRETIWRQYSEYVTVAVGLGPVRRTEKFASLVENIVTSSVVAGKVLLARVGGEEEEQEFVWLERAEWPSGKERQAWSEFRTVHQAVRCAIQEIISSGQRYSGVFGQVKQVHEFVTEHTNFSKKQIRSALISQYQYLYIQGVPKKGGNKKTRLLFFSTL